MYDNISTRIDHRHFWHAAVGDDVRFRLYRARFLYYCVWSLLKTVRDVSRPTPDRRCIKNTARIHCSRIDLSYVRL